MKEGARKTRHVTFGRTIYNVDPQMVEGRQVFVEGELRGYYAKCDKHRYIKRDAYLFVPLGGKSMTFESVVEMMEYLREHA